MQSARTARPWVILLLTTSSALSPVVRAQDTSRGQPPSVAATGDTGSARRDGDPSTSASAAGTDGKTPGPPDTTAQTAMAYIAAGDRARAARKADAALTDFALAIGLDSTNYVALYSASREAVDLGEFEPDPAVKRQDLETGLGFARRAVAANPAGADGHFAVARALGRQALSVGGKKRIEFAKVVRAEALAALSDDPQHAGALHVMGVWNAEVMRLSGIERFIARNLLGGGILGTASWKDAVRYMEESVAVEPNRIVHHLDLGKIYADVGDKAKAREQFETVLALPSTEYNDPHYKEDAQRQLARL
jgi:tetratricopeptide (TPR) repeat protein